MKKHIKTYITRKEGFNLLFEAVFKAVFAVVDEGPGGPLIQLHHLELHHAVPDLLLQVLLLGVPELVVSPVVVSQIVWNGVLLGE